MRFYYFIISIVFISLLGNAQNITIKGRAHSSYVGKEITLYDYTDYITYTKTKESSDTIDANGYFELKLQNDVTKPILLNIDNLMGKLYVQPKFVYGVYFPEKTTASNANQEGTEGKVNITVYGKDSSELNALVIDFNTQYNASFSKLTDGYLSPSKLNAQLDSFAVFCNKRYKTLPNRYFKSYVNYSLAGFYTNTSRSKTLLYKQFIENKPILYHHYEYMDFFNAYYKGYLKSFASTKTGGSIFNSINKFADYTDLKNTVKVDKNINNDTLRELVLLKGLIEFYYSPDFDKQQVQSVIEQLQRETTYAEHKKITQQFLQTLYKLQPGADAPDFVAEDKTGNAVTLSSYKGKYVYLNFFSTQSDNSLKEMNKLMDLKKKFSDKVTFISVCLDDTESAYKAYLKANPKYDWAILYNGKHSTAKRNYNLQSLSGFFLINQQMQLLQSPAPAPSEGIEYKFNALFKPKKKNTIIGVR